MHLPCLLGDFITMKIFISHNYENKETARLLAVELVERGFDVWFDEWQLKPGDSITGGIETGISECDTFVLIWSTQAQQSNWVDTELRAALRRRVDDTKLRVIPVMLDDTALPALVADYRGFHLRSLAELKSIANHIAGDDSLIDMAQRLQRRLLELAVNEFPEEDPIKALICPKCASKKLVAYNRYDEVFDETIYYVMCDDCNWGHAKKASDA